MWEYKGESADRLRDTKPSVSVVQHINQGLGTDTVKFRQQKKKKKMKKSDEISEIA